MRSRSPASATESTTRICSSSSRGFPVLVERLCWSHLITSAQECGRACDDLLSDDNPLAQLDRITVGEADRDHTHLDATVIDDRDGAARRALDDRGRRYAQRNTMCDFNCATGECADIGAGLRPESDAHLAQASRLVDLAGDE